MKKRKELFWRLVAVLVAFALLLDMNVFSMHVSASSTDELLPESSQIYLDGDTVTAFIQYAAVSFEFVYVTLQCSDAKDGSYEDVGEVLYYYDVDTSSGNTIKYTPKSSSGTKYYRLKCVSIYDTVYTEPVAITTAASDPTSVPSLIPTETPTLIPSLTPTETPTPIPSVDPNETKFLPESFRIYLDGNAVAASIKYSAKSDEFIYASLQCSDKKGGPYQDTTAVLYYFDVNTSSGNTIKYTPEGNGDIKYYRLKCEFIYNTVYTPVTALMIPMAVPKWNRQGAASYTRCNKISWERSNNAVSYQIYRSKNKNSGFKKIATMKNPALSSKQKMEKLYYYDSKLSPNRAYYYRIAAVNKNGVQSKLSEANLTRTGKKTKNYKAKAVLPDFKSYAGISGKTSTQKNIYGIRQKVIKYRKVKEDMYHGYVKLLKKKTYQLKSCADSSGEASYDYKGGAKIVHGSAVNKGNNTYGTSYDMTLSYDSSKKLMKLTVSPSFKLKAVAKKYKYKKSKKDKNKDKNSNKYTDPSKSPSNNTSLHLCLTCGGTGKCQKCHGRRLCPACNGRGGMSYNTWGQGGSGWVKCSGCHGSRMCWGCGGSGRCPTCGGSGRR